MIADDIAEALELLGPDVESVAQSLRRAGIRGLRNEATSCPIALYIQYHIPYVDDVEVVSDVTFTNELGGSSCVSLPPQCDKFVVQFDQGKFPELDIFQEDE